MRIDSPDDNIIMVAAKTKPNVNHQQKKVLDSEQTPERIRELTENIEDELYDAKNKRIFTSITSNAN